MGKRRTSEPPANAFRVSQKGARPRFVDGGGTVHVEATEAFYHAVEAVFKGTEFDQHLLTVSGSLAVRNILPNIGSFYPYGAGAVMYVADPEKREALNALFLAVQEAIGAAHESGVERGKSLLVQLASGALTTSEFNNSVIKGEKEE